MGKTRAEKLYAILAVLVLVVFMGSIFVYYLRQHDRIIGGETGSLESMEEELEIDWRERYPFQAEEDVSEEKEVAEKDESPYVPSVTERYQMAFEDLKYRIGYYTENTIIARDSIIIAAAGIRGCCHWPNFSAGNELIQLYNGYLTYQEALVSDSDIEEIADSVSGLNEYLSDKGIGFLYVNAGSKVNPHDRMMSENNQFYENTNENGDHLVQALEERNVDYIDFRTEMLDAGLDWYASYYRADHHWKTTTQLWAAGILAEKLNQDYGYAFDESYFDIQRYSVSHYEKNFLGGQGRTRADLSYLEDFDLLLPQFDTDFTVCIPTKNLEITGEYRDTLIDMDTVHEILGYEGAEFLEKEDFYHISRIQNEPNTRIKNHMKNNNEEKKILILQDSFGWYLTGFLAMDVSEIHVIHPAGFNGSIRSYIEEMQPDMVILLYCERNITPIDWSTHQSTFDLR